MVHQGVHPSTKILFSPYSYTKASSSVPTGKLPRRLSVRNRFRRTKQPLNQVLSTESHVWPLSIMYHSFIDESSKWAFA